MPPIPTITKELIEYLEAIYPDKAPKLNDSDRQIWATVGQVELVRHLRAIHDQQTETILENVTNV